MTGIEDMGSGSLMAQDKWTAWPHVTSSRFLAMHASQIPGEELETSCSKLSIVFCFCFEKKYPQKMESNVNRCVSNGLQIQLPRSVRFARIGLFIPTAVRISYAAQAVVVAAVAHDHVDLTDSMVRCGVNRFVLDEDG